MTDDTRVGSREPETADTDGDEQTGTRSAETQPADAQEADEQEAGAGEGDGSTAVGEPATKATEATKARKARTAGKAGTAAETAGSDDVPARGGRATLPLVPVLAVLLVLLLGGTGYLWATRPGSSSVATGDYVDALQAARAGIVDVTSFDYLTLDDDISQIQAVTTGDLTQESVDRLNGSRQSLTDAQAVVNTEVVGAAVGAADDSTATVYMVIQSTQTSSASQQAQVQRYRIEVDLTKDGDRWLLSGIQGR